MFARTRDGIGQHAVSQPATCYWAAKVSFRSTGPQPDQLHQDDLV